MKKTTNKTFDAVKFMREQSDELSAILATMTKAEIVAYFKKIQQQTSIKPSA